MALLLDEIGLLAPEERSRVEAAVREFVAATGADLCVQIVRSVPGRAFREHAAAARRRHAGDEARSLILVVSAEDRHAEIATAPAHARIFTGGASTDLLQASLVPLMRQGRSGPAIVSAVEAMGRLLRGGVGGGPAEGVPTAAGRPGRQGCLPVAIVLGVVLAAVGGLLGYHHHRERKCVECGAQGKITATVVRAATETAEGLKEVRFSCPKCSYSSVRQVPISRVTHHSSYSSSDGSSFDSGSSGGDSGGGGGSDGGGGASW